MKKGLKKSDKLRFGSEFDRMRREGVKLAGRNFLLVSAPPIEGNLKCGVVCGKKYSLLAVERNRARRLLWESFRLMKPYLAPCTLTLIPRRRMMAAKRGEITLELLALAEQAGVLALSPDRSALEC